MVINTEYNKPLLYPNPYDIEKDRKGYAKRLERPSKVVIHSTNNTKGNTTFESEIEFLYKSIKVGTDYLVGKNEIVQFFESDRFFGWHAGIVTPAYAHFGNPYSIGIETHYSPKDSKPFPEESMLHLNELVRILIKKYDLSEKDIEMHRTIAPSRKVDPSQFTSDQFYKWRHTFFENILKTYVLIQTSTIYTTTIEDVQYKAPVNDSKPLDCGFKTRGKITENKWLWLENGWGFIPPRHFTELIEV